MKAVRKDQARRVLILLEGLPFSLDRRARLQAQSLTQAGYQVSVIGPRAPGEPGYESQQGMGIYRYPAPPEIRGKIGFIVEYAYSFFMASVLAWKVHRRVGFDVIQAANPPDILFLIARFYRTFFGSAFVFDHRDISPEIYRERFRKSERSLMIRIMLWLERCSYKTADISMTVNESVKAIAVSRGKMDANDVFIVRCAPDTDRFKPVPAREELRCGRKHLVTYVGIMGAQDGVDCLLHAVKHVVHARGRKDITFAIVGSGDQLGALKTMADEFEVADYVTFPGMIRDDDLLLAYMSTAEVCVAPEPKNDLNDKCSFVKLAEYVAVGKPVVAFDLVEARLSVGDAAVYVTPNDTAEFGDKILDLLDDPERRARMGEIALERSAGLLSWEHSQAHFLAAYDRLFSNT